MYMSFPHFPHNNLWSVVERPPGRAAKYPETTQQTARGGEMNALLTGGYSCSQHAGCTSAAACWDDILEQLLIAPHPQFICVTMLWVRVRVREISL